MDLRFVAANVALALTDEARHQRAIPHDNLIVAEARKHGRFNAFEIGRIVHYAKLHIAATLKKDVAA